MRRLMSVLMCVAAAGLVSCGGDKGPTGPKDGTEDTPTVQTRSPEEARRELGTLGVEYSSEAFLKAVENEDVLAVALFIDAGMDPNTKNDQGEPVLLWALKNGKSSVVDVFLKRKVGLNAQDRDEETALMWAAQANRPDVVERLIEAGADLNLRDEDGYTALTYVVTRNDTTGLKLLLDAKADANADNGRALIIAIQEDNRDFTKTLLDAGADVNSQDDDWTGYQPLAAATSSDMVMLLLEAGADLNATAGGRTALHTTASDGYLGAVEALVAAGLNVNAVGTEGDTPISQAAWSDHQAVVAFLLEAGANPTQTKDTSQALLNFSIRNSNTDILELLLESGVEPDEPHLLSTISNGQFDLTRIFLRYGGRLNVPEVEPYDSGEPGYYQFRTTFELLMRFAEHNDTTLVQLLLEAGVSPNSNGEVLVVREGQGAGGPGFVQIGRHQGETRHVFEDWTALLMAAEQGHDGIVQLLLHAGADPDHRGFIYMEATKGFLVVRALIYATNRGHFPVVQSLIEAGADPNAPMEFWTGGDYITLETPLSLAQYREHTEIAEYLMEHGARE